MQRAQEFTSPPGSAADVATLQTYARGFRGVNAQTGTSYTPVLDDAGTLITHSNAAASTLTPPTNASVAYAIGAVLTVLQIGAGSVTLTESGTTINAPPGKTKVTSGAGAIVSLVKTGTDTWYAYGDLVPA
jgi:hypothetical protein